MFSWNNFDLFVSVVDVETHEKVALKLVSEVVINSHVACFVIFMIHVSIVVVHCIGCYSNTFLYIFIGFLGTCEYKASSSSSL
jgi:hypothetical protein